MENNESKFSKDSCLYTASLSPYISPVMTAVTSKMNRMLLLYTLILSMVYLSLPTILPKHGVLETADKGGYDYSAVYPFNPSYDYNYYYSPITAYSMGQQNEGELLMIP